MPGLHHLRLKVYSLKVYSYISTAADSSANRAATASSVECSSPRVGVGAPRTSGARWKARPNSCSPRRTASSTRLPGGPVMSSATLSATQEVSKQRKCTTSCPAAGAAGAGGAGGAGAGAEAEAEAEAEAGGGGGAEAARPRKHLRAREAIEHEAVDRLDLYQGGHDTPQARSANRGPPA